MNKIDKSNVIKAIKKEIAKQYKLSYRPTECTCDVNCSEVTIEADNDWNTLEEQLKRKGIDHIDWYENIWKQLENPGRKVLKDTAFKRRKRFFFKECAISGWSKHDPEEWWGEVDEGEQLVLIRDYNNKHDSNAVAVAFAGDYEGDPENFDFEYIIGYVPKSDNELIAQLMDQGLHNTFIAELTTKKMDVSMKRCLRMTIYVLSDDELEDVEALSCNTFAVKVNKDDFKDISNELGNLGFVEFQWGGFPISLRDLPQKDDEVIFLCPTGRKTRLYRMKVMARGEYEAAKFLDFEPDDLILDDDTTIFVLTNIQGPLSCKNKDLEFLDFQQIPAGEPEGRLSSDLKEHFIHLFDSE
jgi:hypothetical protein